LPACAKEAQAPTTPVVPTPTPIPTPTPTKPFEEELVVVLDTFNTETALPHLGNFGDLGLWVSTYEYLVYRDPESGQPSVPGVAERWEISDDKTQYTFYLRKGIQFHDGWGELTAEDVKFSFDMAVREGSICSRAGYFRDTVQSIVVENPYKVSFFLKDPNWEFMDSCSSWQPFLPVICKKYIETVGEEEANLKPIGSGPYRFVDRSAGDFIKFEAVADHWRNVPEFKWLTLRAVPEVSTRASMLQAGEADIASLPFDRVAGIEKAGFRTVVNPGALLYWLVLGSLTLPTHPEFDPSVPWWADPADTKEWERALKVRMAMNLAVNKQEIIDVLFSGKASLFGTPFYWPGEEGWDPAWEPYPYDPEKAKRLLAEAGYPDGFEVSVIPMCMPGRPESIDLTEAVAIYWEKIGLDVKRDVMDWVTLKPTMFARNTKGCWIYGMPWYDEPIMAISKQCFSSEIFLTGAEVAYLDNVGGQAIKEVDAEKRNKLSRQWGQYAYDNYLVVPLCGKGKLWALSDRVGEWPLVPGVSFTAHQLDYVTLKR